MVNFCEENKNIEKIKISSSIKNTITEIKVIGLCPFFLSQY